MSHFIFNIISIIPNTVFEKDYNVHMEIDKSKSFDPTTITKVLIIDADQKSREVARTALQNDYLILEANSGISGIDLTIDTEPDLIFISLDLPEMNGFEVSSRLQILVPKTPIVAMAEQVLLGTKNFGIAVGFYGYIQKPLNTSEIQQAAQDFLKGKREKIDNKDEYLIAYQSELAHRLEEKVREQTDFKRRANYLIEQNNIMIDLLERRKKLLESAAKSAKEITAILNIQELLPLAAKTIKNNYHLEYIGIYLLNPKEQILKLSASAPSSKNNKAQEISMSKDDKTILKQAIISKQAQVEASKTQDSLVAPTANEIALPLIIGNTILGAVTIKSTSDNQFEETDITALQIMADQLAIAIQNANTLEELDKANQEIVRTKTFEAIATATGEAIHWVGNKATPITGSAARIREDIAKLILIHQYLINLPENTRQNHPFWEIFTQTRKDLSEENINTDKIISSLLEIPKDKISLFIDYKSIMEDINIIEESARTILNIKEDLIGPARKQEIELINIQNLLHETGKKMGLPKGILQYEIDDNLPKIKADRRQLERVYTNLIKNAWEALDNTKAPQIFIKAKISENPNMIRTAVKDNGPGIPSEIMDKIWVSFFTTKKNHGGTGLGLSACMEIINQAGGTIHVESNPDVGAEFIVLLPISD